MNSYLLVVSCILPPDEVRRSKLKMELEICLSSARDYPFDLFLYTNSPESAYRLLRRLNWPLCSTIVEDATKSMKYVNQQTVGDFRYAFSKCDALAAVDRYMREGLGSKYEKVIVSDTDTIWFPSGSFISLLEERSYDVVAVDYGMHFKQDNSIIGEINGLERVSLENFRWLNSGFIMLDISVVSSLVSAIDRYSERVANTALEIKGLIGHYSDEVLFNMGIGSLGSNVMALSNKSSNNIAQFYWTIETETTALSLSDLLRSNVGHMHLPDLKIKLARLRYYILVVKFSPKRLRRSIVKISLAIEKLFAVFIKELSRVSRRCV